MTPPSTSLICSSPVTTVRFLPSVSTVLPRVSTVLPSSSSVPGVLAGSAGTVGCTAVGGGLAAVDGGVCSTASGRATGSSEGVWGGRVPCAIARPPLTQTRAASMLFVRDICHLPDSSEIVRPTDAETVNPSRDDSGLIAVLGDPVKLHLHVRIQEPVQPDRP